MKRHKTFSFFHCAVTGFMTATCLVYPALAGTQGAYMNSAGTGVAVDAIKMGKVTSSASSPYMSGPSAGVNPLPAPPGEVWAATAGLPYGAPASCYCQSRGYSNYIWSIQAYVAGGATADNDYLDGELVIDPSPGPAQIAVNVQAFFEENGVPVPGFPNALSGNLLVNGTASAGSAIGLLGYEYTGGSTNPTLEEITSGALRFKYLLPGPFDYGEQGDTCDGLKIPFTTITGHENLHIVMHTIAKSEPITLVSCPEDVTFHCSEPVVYPIPEATGGLDQDIYVAYDPPAEALPLGSTLVKATFTYADGTPVLTPPAVEGENWIPLQCEFTATRSGVTFSGFYSPLKGTSEPGDSRPLLTAKQGSVIPVKFEYKCDDTPIIGVAAPKMLIESCATGAVITDGDFDSVGTEWHFNWNTDGVPAGDYKLHAQLFDGTEKMALVRIK